MANNFPTIKPSLNLQLARTGILPPDVTFTRASSSGGYYDGKTVAKAEENLLRFSQEFDNAAFSKTNLTVTANTTVAPDGTTTADTLTASAGNTEHFTGSDDFSAATGARIVLSIFAKKGTHDFIQLAVGNQAAAFANFDLDTGVVGTTGGLVSSSITETTAGSGIYRLVIVFDTATVIGRSLLAVIVGSDSATRRQAFDAAGTETVIVWGAQAEIRDSVTAYTPTTTQPITRFQPKLEYAIANEPVFDHDPVTGEALGLSIFEARTNRLLRSEEFDNASWVKFNVTVSTNQIIAPDGTLTADAIVSSSASKAQVDQRFALAASTVFTNSVYLKAKEYTTAEVIIIDRSGSARGVVVDLIAGTITATPGGPISSSITAVGNGWFRVTVTASTLTGGTSPGSRYHFPSSAGTSVDGNGIFIWGAQLEAGAFATPYIPTVGSTVTRSADAAVMTGANFSRFYRADEGTFVVEAATSSVSSDSRALSVSDNTFFNRVTIFFSSASHLRAQSSGGLSVDLDAGSITANEFTKVASAYKVMDYATTINGGSVVTGANTGTLPVVDRAHIGAGANGGNRISGHIKSLQYYPARLTNDNLVAVTA